MCEPFEKIYPYKDVDGWGEPQYDEVLEHCGVPATQWECQLPEQKKILRGWVCSAEWCTHSLGTNYTCYQNWPIKEVV